MNIKTFTCLCAMSAALVIGCTTGQQRTAYTTIASTEATATSVYDGYLTAVVRGYAATNQLPDISMRFNQIQLGLKIAAVSSQAGTNAITPEVLIGELTDFTSLVQSLIQHQ